MPKATIADVASVVETIAVAFTQKSDLATLAETLLIVGKDTLESTYACARSTPRQLHLATAINHAWSAAATLHNDGKMVGAFAERIQQLHMFEIDTTLTKPFVSPILKGDEDTVLEQARSVTWVWRTTDVEAVLISELLCTVSLGFVTHTKIITPTGDRSTDMANVMAGALSELLERVDVVNAIAYPKVGSEGMRVTPGEVLDNAMAIGYDFSQHSGSTIVTCNIDFPLWGQTRSVRASGPVIDREVQMAKALAATLDALVFDFAEGTHSVQRSLKAIRTRREIHPTIQEPAVMPEPTSANIGGSMPRVVDVTIDPNDPDPDTTRAILHQVASEAGVQVGDSTAGVIADEEQVSHVKPNFVPLGIEIKD